MEDFKDHASVTATTERNVLHNFTFKPVAENYIRKILDNLNTRKAVGCDNISQRLQRLSASAIALEVTVLINHFIKNRVWPLEWKVVISPWSLTSWRKQTGRITVRHLCLPLFPRYMKKLFDQVYEEFYGNFFSGGGGGGGAIG